MHTIVCIKQVPDPETPSASFRIDTTTNRVIPAQGIAPVVDPYGENAVEAALQVKDKLGGTVTAISMGDKAAREALKHVMSMGVDEGILLDDPAFQDGDSYATARTLAAAIQKAAGDPKFGPFDLVLCGRQSSDTDMGQVGPGLAELLGIPSTTIALKIEVSAGTARVERIAEDGRDVIELSLPGLVTISNEVGSPRYPTLRGIMSAAKKEVTTWGTADLGLSPSDVGRNGSRQRLRRLFIPVRDSKCEIIEADSVPEAAVKLALRLREAKII